MRRIIKVRVGNEILHGIEREFEVTREEWNSYKLLDGGTVRLKTSTLKIIQIVDEEGNPQYDEQGDPRMVVRHRSDIVAAL